LISLQPLPQKLEKHCLLKQPQSHVRKKGKIEENPRLLAAGKGKNYQKRDIKNLIK
jgi:hypothetical protein